MHLFDSQPGREWQKRVERAEKSRLDLQDVSSVTLTSVELERKRIYVPVYGAENLESALNMNKTMYPSFYSDKKRCVFAILH